MKDNLNIANILANSFNKENGVIVYSGTLAVESALICAGIKKDDKVLVSGAACYSIFEAITKVGAIPVILIPENKLILTINEIKNAIKKEKNIKCFIAVHQYGIVQNMREVKKLFKDDIIIIEDVAQAWNILDGGFNAGMYSDYVITSFGKTKPLSYGIGGAVFSNNSLKEHFDFCDNESRKSSMTLIPYIYPECKKININKLIKIGDNNVKKQRKVAELLTLGLAQNDKVEIITDSVYNSSAWHRFPIIIKNKKYARKVQIALEKSKTKYQLPHEDELYEIDMVSNSSAIIVGESKKEYDIILIRTRNNRIKAIKKFLGILGGN